MELDRRLSDNSIPDGMDNVAEEQEAEDNDFAHQQPLSRVISATGSIMPHLTPHQQQVNRRTILKLDYILLPFLSLLFLLNHLDKVGRSWCGCVYVS